MILKLSRQPIFSEPCNIRKDRANSRKTAWSVYFSEMFANKYTILIDFAFLASI